MRRRPEPDTATPDDPITEVDRLLDEIRAAIDAGLRRVRDEQAMERAGVPVDRRSRDEPIPHHDRRSTDVEEDQ